jgi:hypothetical protein
MLAVCEKEATRIMEEQKMGETGFTACHKCSFDVVLERSKLANMLKHVYESLLSSGQISVLINNWIHVSFILPSVTRRPQALHSVTMETYHAEYLRMCDIRPYHAILLMEDEESLCNSLPEDASPCLKRLIQLCSPLKR